MVSRLVSSVSLLLAVLGCASAPHFPLRAPLIKDDDQRPFAQAPEEYYSPFAWDGANYMVFHPVARFFAVDPAGAATNVNAWDEVPDSSWFENRLGLESMTPSEVTRGSCGDKVLDPNGPDGSWTIDKACCSDVPAVTATSRLRGRLPSGASSDWADSVCDAFSACSRCRDSSR